MDILLVLGRIISIFLIVFLGVLAFKLNWLPKESENYLMKLMMNVTGPCLIFSSMQGQDFSDEMIKKSIEALGFMTIVIIFTSILSIFLVKLLKAPIEDRGIYRMIIVFTNCGFMGYPLAEAVFGQEGLFLSVISNMAFIILIFSLGAFLLIYDKENAGSIKDTFKTILSIPLVSSVIGLLIFAFNIKFPIVISDTFNIVGDMTAPISMIIIGIQLSQSSIKKVLANKRLFIVTLLRMILVPLLLFGIFMWAPIDPLVFCVVIFAMAMPAAAFIGVLSSRYNCNSQLAAEGIFVSTAFSLITIPIAGTLLSYYLYLVI